MTRRNHPTPIRIPSLSMYGPQVQIVRSAERNSSRPLSEVSSPESSAVSGQTLARALLGNSFVLSNDGRSSRYRSGFGGLVRSDSATLPRGDHPLMNSPYWRDRTLSGTSDTFSADLRAPPIPPNADKVYIPPQTPRQSGIEMKRKTNVRRHSSAGSLHSPVSKDDSNGSKSRPNSVSEITREIENIEDIQALRRISRISEAPSSPSTTTANPEIPPHIPSPSQSPIDVQPAQATPSGLSAAAEPQNSPPSISSNLKSPGVSSTVASPATKELEGVLDYYASSDTPQGFQERAFAPAFSPIIEESSSQLSSPASRRLSHRTTQSRTTSPLSGTTHGRMDLSTVRRPSDGAVISKASNPRRRSVQSSTPDPSSPQVPPQTSSDMNPNGSTSGHRTSLIPSSIGRTAGGRIRSGSAPSPIKITRDSRDLNAYKIISPLPENASETPSTGDSDGIELKQTFPVTPNAFSPFWSPGPSPGMEDGSEVSPTPRTPMSATLPGIGVGTPPSLDQQILLTRAATMVRTRHSRQGSMSKYGIGLKALPRPQAPAASAEHKKMDEGRDADEMAGSQVVEVPAAQPAEFSPVSSSSQYSEPSMDVHSPYGMSPSPVVGGAAVGIPPSSSSTTGSSPGLPYLSGDNSSHSTYPSPSITPLPSNISSSYRLDSNPEFTNPFGSHPSSPPRFDTQTFSPHTHSGQTLPPVVITPPAGDPTSAPSPYHGRSLRRISEISHNLESPPPYDTIDQDQPPSLTSNSGTSTNEPQFIGASSQPSPSATQDSSNEYLPLSRKTSVASRDRRGRNRPMAPTGPRRPLSHINNHPTAGRARGASVSSVASAAPNSNATATLTRKPSLTPPPSFSPHSPNTQPESDPSSSVTVSPPQGIPAASDPTSPDFEVPATQYRGMTMEEAKWSFTSAQLQTIVSRAIRQSAEASSIRLLRLEILDNEIPQELALLEARKAEVIAKYRSSRRTSEGLLTKLSTQIEAGGPNPQKTLEELRDVTRQLNALSQELHSIDQRQASIQELVQKHSASALSMALRKLNASFVKERTQTQELHRQVMDLQDEIWTINELRSSKERSPQSNPSAQASSSQQAGSNTTEQTVNGSPESERKRTISSATIVRKPSLNYSRSIRFSGSRLSQRSSLSSNGGRTSLMLGSGVSGMNSAFSARPVPPLPRRRPTDIITDASARSTAFLSADGSPNTEAMIKAQDELYRILGMSLNGDHRLRRSHSVIGLPGNPEFQPHPSNNTVNNFLQPMITASRSESLDSGSLSNRASRGNARPLSYPASLLEAYNPLDVDRHAMLATLEMISRDEQ
ncbi:hypothetical protein P691DRAFT_809502 [Macrolepiota fuliginosa MF-IS2]|uniref:Uncharacterized protein n=1 Tax=Macrolepiota fuliginosa MF-IS2 TaxID=1400762 RepID=A0A9P6C3K6_9AGAR|nr:hypothetical protein P691DRAFT_809502 [Macrolepiota fuliginosa MF-IS2]